MACGLDSQARLLRLVGARRRAVPSDGRLPAAVRRQARSSRPAVPGMLALVGLDSWVGWTFPRSSSHPVALSPCPTLPGAEGRCRFLGHRRQCSHVEACSCLGPGLLPCHLLHHDRII